MASLWGELQRRNVVKVCAAYAVVGWLLVQIAATFFPALQMPAWTVTLVASLIILGFPLALVLAWAYELTPDGIARSPRGRRRGAPTSSVGRLIDYAIMAGLVVVLGFLSPTSRPRTRKSRRRRPWRVSSRTPSRYCRSTI